MTAYLGKSCSFGLPRVPFVNCRQFTYLVISLFGFEGRIWDLIVSVPDHCLSFYLEDHGRHFMLSFLSSLLISVLRILDTEANKFYDRNHQLYDAGRLTRCYTQHALRPFIDSETNH